MSVAHPCPPVAANTPWVLIAPRFADLSALGWADLANPISLSDLNVVLVYTIVPVAFIFLLLCVTVAIWVRTRRRRRRLDKRVRWVTGNWPSLRGERAQWRGFQ